MPAVVVDSSVLITLAAGGESHSTFRRVIFDLWKFTA
jgi:hypothetical protein